MMKRRLFTQMRTEWRSNVWMIVELTIVGLIVALITMVLAQIICSRNGNEGFDLTDVYVGSNNALTKDADNYVQYDDLQPYFEDMNVLLRKLRDNQYVDMVATGSEAMPYNYNYHGNKLRYCADGDTLLYQGNLRYFSPELVRLVRLTGPRGETTEQLATALENGEWLVSPHADFDFRPSCDPYQIKGKSVIMNDDATNVVHVGAVCYGIPRTDYEPIIGGCIITSFRYYRGLPTQIIVRVKPGMGRKFLESLKSKDLEQGNLYFNNFTSIEDMRDNAQRDIDNTMRNLVICAVFLLVAVFLGFLGSFWFRTQQRVPEIALRKVNGATQWQIFSRLISEGLILLLISTLIFTPICFYLIHIGVTSGFMNFGPQMPTYIAYVITLVLLAAMIIAGIWFPARRAMKVEPANALKDQ
jgi:putative ABC transport system permease protein